MTILQTGDIRIKYYTMVIMKLLLKLRAIRTRIGEFALMNMGLRMEKH
jgi:hypothetical protein